ncbi:MAG: ATP-binding cassette domain-containing protein [Calditrichaeota bacterium]|nr:MAG: ATP-binding cassette domain-containing protein [Calditrichota bacterium]
MTIQIQNLSKIYTSHVKEPGFLGSLKSLVNRKIIEKKAVNDVSFEIGEGEFVGLIGENGAGKTTLIKMLSGIIFPTSGDAKVLGFRPWERKNEYKKNFSVIMGQKNQLWWDLPAHDSFLLLKDIYEIEDSDFKKRLDYLTETLGMQNNLNTQVRKLSLGERMKAEIIAALLHSPKVVYLDEPTIGLDVIAQESIRKFLKEYNEEQKTTIILTSHYMDDIEALCERVVIMDNGKKQFDGKLAGVIEKYANEKIITLNFADEIEKSSLTKFGAVVSLKQSQVEIKVNRKNSTQIAGDLLKNYEITDINIRDISVEEIVRNIFKEGN